MRLHDNEEALVLVISTAARTWAAAGDRCHGPCGTGAFANSIFHTPTPPVLDIADYFRRFIAYAGASRVVYVVALAYVARALNGPLGSMLRITSYTIHRLVFAACVLAAKYFDDQYMTNRYYADIGGITLVEANELEMQMLKAINWSCGISMNELVDFETYIIDIACRESHVVRIRLEGLGVPDISVRAEAPSRSSSHVLSPIAPPRRLAAQDLYQEHDSTSAYCTAYDVSVPHADSYGLPSTFNSDGTESTPSGICGTSEGGILYQHCNYSAREVHINRKSVQYETNEYPSVYTDGYHNVQPYRTHHSGQSSNVDPSPAMQSYQGGHAAYASQVVPVVHSNSHSGFRSRPSTRDTYSQRHREVPSQCQYHYWESSSAVRNPYVSQAGGSMHNFNAQPSLTLSASYCSLASTGGHSDDMEVTYPCYKKDTSPVIKDSAIIAYSCQFPSNRSGDEVHVPSRHTVRAPGPNATPQYDPFSWNTPWLAASHYANKSQSRPQVYLAHAAYHVTVG